MPGWAPGTARSDSHLGTLGRRASQGIAVAPWRAVPQASGTPTMSLGAAREHAQQPGRAG
eukprot:748605-Alexandrium_andersonii.AAC.1